MGKEEQAQIMNWVDLCNNSQEWYFPSVFFYVTLILLNVAQILNYKILLLFIALHFLKSYVCNF